MIPLGAGIHRFSIQAREKSREFCAGSPDLQSGAISLVLLCGSWSDLTPSLDTTLKCLQVPAVESLSGKGARSDPALAQDKQPQQYKKGFCCPSRCT